MKRFPFYVLLVVLLSMLFSFIAAAEVTEAESVSHEEFSTFALETTSDTSFEVVSETSPVSGVSDEQATIINRLDLIYTLGLFFVAFLAALLVIFILWRVLDVFI